MFVIVGDGFSIDGGAPQPITSAYGALAAAHDAGASVVAVDPIPDCSYGDALAVLDAARSAGFTDVRVALGSRVTDLRFRAQSRTTLRSATPSQQTVVVMARSDTFISIDGQVTTLADIDPQLMAAIADHRLRGFSARISLVEDAHTHWATALAIIAAARRANDLQIGFVTQ